MNDLIDSNGSIGKVVQYEEIYPIICISWAWVQLHVITEPINSLAPTSGQFLSKLLQTS